MSNVRDDSFEEDELESSTPYKSSRKRNVPKHIIRHSRSLFPIRPSGNLKPTVQGQNVKVNKIEDRGKQLKTKLFVDMQKKNKSIVSRSFMSKIESKDRLSPELEDINPNSDQSIEKNRELVMSAGEENIENNEDLNCTPSFNI